MCKKKTIIEIPEKSFVVVCSTGLGKKEPTPDWFRVSYETLEEAYRKFLHTIWYFKSMKHEESFVCSLFQNNKIVYNYTKTKEKNELIDCLDGSKTNYDLTMDELSKMILTAIMQYEAMVYNTQIEK